MLIAALASACGAVTSATPTVTRAFAEHLSGVEVTAEGTVARLLADSTGPSGTHQRFIVQAKGSAQTVLIENNVDIGKRVPLSTGDDVVVHGEYVWNAQGGLIHFTHHDPAHTHEDGWIDAKGTRYSYDIGSVGGRAPELHRFHAVLPSLAARSSATNSVAA